MTELEKLTKEVFAELVARDAILITGEKTAITATAEEVHAEILRRLTPRPTGDVGNLIKDIETSLDMAQTVDPAWIDLMLNNEWPKLKAAFTALQTSESEWRGLVRDLLENWKSIRHSDDIWSCNVCGEETESSTLCTNPKCPAVKAREALEAME